MSKYYSQIGQDQYFIEHISKGKRDGVYLDIGANDGIFDSNTAALEFDYGWTGICVEANPRLIEDLTAARPKAKVVNCAVWHTPGELELEITGSNRNGTRGDLLSRVTKAKGKNNYFKEHFKESSEVVRIKARTITDIVREQFGLPFTFDYMSLDIEGAELEALKGIDFSQIEIRFMTIEHGGREKYLKQIAGYLGNYGYTVHRENQWDVELERDPAKPLVWLTSKSGSLMSRIWGWLKGSN
jgi:FkbM family methyltransferase